MSEFWWGVLALPIIALSIAAAVAALFGSWLLLEKWASGRWAKLPPVTMPRPVGSGLGTTAMELWTVGDLGKRGQFAAAILAGGTVRGFGLGNWALLAAGGKPDAKNARIIEIAILNALLEVAKADHQEAGS